MLNSTNEAVFLSNTDSSVSKEDDVRIDPFSTWSLVNSKLVVHKNVHFGPYQQIILKNANLEIFENASLAAYVTIKVEGLPDNKTYVNIGKNERIDEYCHLECRASLTIEKDGHLFSGAYMGPFKEPYYLGEKVTLGQKVVVAGRGPLKVGKYSLIGTSSVIITENHKYKKLREIIRKQGFEAKGIVIGSDVWVGAMSTILDGSLIRDKTVIGAGSLVKGETISGGVYYGVPIRKSISLRRC